MQPFPASITSSHFEPSAGVKLTAHSATALRIAQTDSLAPSLEKDGGSSDSEKPQYPDLSAPSSTVKTQVDETSQDTKNNANYTVNTRPSLPMTSSLPASEDLELGALTHTVSASSEEDDFTKALKIYSVGIGVSVILGPFALLILALPNMFSDVAKGKKWFILGFLTWVVILGSIVISAAVIVHHLRTY